MMNTLKKNISKQLEYLEDHYDSVTTSYYEYCSIADFDGLTEEQEERRQELKREKAQTKDAIAACKNILFHIEKMTDDIEFLESLYML